MHFWPLCAVGLLYLYHYLLVSYSLGHCDFIVKLDIESCQSLRLFSTELIILSLSYLHINFKINSSTSIKWALPMADLVAFVALTGHQMKATEERVYVGSQSNMVKKAGCGGWSLIFPPRKQRGKCCYFASFSLPFSLDPSLWMALPTSMVTPSTSVESFWKCPHQNLHRCVSMVILIQWHWQWRLTITVTSSRIRPLVGVIKTKI